MRYFHQCVLCVESRHLLLEGYRALLKNIETAQVFEKSEVKVWECRNCGHIVVGTKAPVVCPVCNHPQSYFEVHEENYQGSVEVFTRNSPKAYDDNLIENLSEKAMHDSLIRLPNRSYYYQHTV